MRLLLVCSPLSRSVKSAATPGSREIDLRKADLGGAELRGAKEIARLGKPKPLRRIDNSLKVKILREFVTFFTFSRHFDRKTATGRVGEDLGLPLAARAGVSFFFSAPRKENRIKSHGSYTSSRTGFRRHRWQEHPERRRLSNRLWETRKRHRDIHTGAYTTFSHKMTSYEEL